MDQEDEDNGDPDVPATPPLYVRGLSPQTPMDHKKSSKILVDHNRASVHAYVREDLKDAKGGGLDVFLEVILGLTPSDLNNWVSIIREQKWYKDQVLVDGLKEFCGASEEPERYIPLATIANRVMEMAHGRLPGVPDAYPIDDICVVHNDPIAMQTIEAHGDLGAIRRPDLLTIRKVHAANLVPKDKKRGAPGVKWVQDIMNWELKGKKCLSAVFSAFLEDRENSVIKSNAGGPSYHNLPTASSPSVKAVKIVKAVKPAKGTRIAKTLKVPVRRQPARRVKQQRPIQATHTEIVGPNVVAPSTEVVDLPVAVPAIEVVIPTLPSPDTTVHAGVKRPAEHNLLNDIRRPDPPGDIRDLDRFTSNDASSFAAKEASIQAGSYALETLACTFGTRLFCINISVENDKMFFWYYDACGAICTLQGISLVSDFEKAAAIIVGFACCTPERLGAIPTIIKPPSSAPYPGSWPSESLSNHTLMLKRPGSQGRVKVTFQESVFTQYALSGRRTFVYTIKTSPALSKDELIIKLSYQVNTRKKEQKIVDKARKAGVGHLPEIHLSGDLWQMSDGVRRAFFEKEGVEYEDRTLRAIVYTRYLPLQALFPHSPESIPLMTSQIIECLYDLREKANILHRDISLHNVMHEIRDGKLYFVLIDFDMATILSSGKEASYSPSSRFRTGTLPFMAVELVENAASFGEPGYAPIAHLVRHDVESVFWLALWCVMVLMEPKGEEEKARRAKNISIVRAWETAELIAIANSKTLIRKRRLRQSKISLLGQAKCLANWFKAWDSFWYAIDHTLEQRDKDVEDAEDRGHAPPPFDNETVNGLFTCDKLMKTLTNAWPDLRVAGPAVEDVALGNEKAGPSSSPVLDDARVAGRRTGKGAALPKKSASKKTKTLKKNSTSRKNSAEGKKTNTSRQAARFRTILTTVKPGEQENGEGENNDMRNRLRPRRRV